MINVVQPKFDGAVQLRFIAYMGPMHAHQRRRSVQKLQFNEYLSLKKVACIGLLSILSY